MRDGARVCIVDWEYAGMNDRYFDLGNLSVNNGFDDEDDRALLELYFDEPVTEARFASLQLVPHRLGLPRGDVGRRAAAPLGARLRLRRATRPSTSHRLERAAADPRVEEWLAVAATA